MSDLDRILHVDVWNKLSLETKVIVKILQHIRSKMYDGAEVRAWLDDDEIIITTYKSEIRITNYMIKFKRRTADGALRVQYVRMKLDNELINAIKKEIINILEYDTEPDYETIVNTLESYFNRSDEQVEAPSEQNKAQIEVEQ